MYENENLSEEIQEVAEPVIEQETDESTEVEAIEPETQEAETDEVEVVEQPPERDLERDSAFAKIRREAEEAKREKEKYDAELKKAKDVIKLFGFEGDDYAEQMEAFHKGITVEQLKQQKQVEEQRVKSILESDPEYKAFKERAKELEFEKTKLADLMYIKTQYPLEQAGKIEDIPNFSKFAELRSRGYEASDAYFIANKDNLMTKKVNAAKQKAISAEQKEHFTKLGGSAGTDDMLEIPSDVLESWKEDFPNDTPKQLKERYNRALKLK